MHTEIAIVEGERAEIGRDPRQMSVEDLNAAGHFKRPLLDAIRQNCIECCGGMIAEVRRCRAIACPMWPYRMNHNPFRAEQSTERREASAARLALHRAKMATSEKSSVIVEVTGE